MRRVVVLRGIGLNVSGWLIVVFGLRFGFGCVLGWIRGYVVLGFGRWLVAAFRAGFGFGGVRWWGFGLWCANWCKGE